jgi:hypothetical protein
LATERGRRRFWEGAGVGGAWWAGGEGGVDDAAALGALVDGDAGEAVGVGVDGGVELGGDAGTDLGELGDGGGFEEFGEAKVEEFDLAGLAAHGVGEFDVAMEHAHAVGAGEAAGEADAELEEFLPGDRARLQVVEADAADVLADDVEPALELADAVDRHHVGVLDAGGGAGLGQEAFAGAGVGVDDVEELDGDRAGRGRGRGRGRPRPCCRGRASGRSGTHRTARAASIARSPWCGVMTRASMGNSAGVLNVIPCGPMGQRPAYACQRVPDRGVVRSGERSEAEIGGRADPRRAAAGGGALGGRGRVGEATQSRPVG